MTMTGPDTSTGGTGPKNAWHAVAVEAIIGAALLIVAFALVALL